MGDAEAEKKPLSEDDVKRIVGEELKTRDARWADAIKKALDGAKTPAAEFKTARKSYLPVWLVALALPFAALGAACALSEPGAAPPRLTEITQQIGLLAFVVALAAYLANVSRELIKTIGAAEAHASESTLGHLTDMRKNLAWVVEAETQLVILGLLVSLRLTPSLAARATGSIGRYDNFLLVYLALIVVNLAFLHARQWRLNSPFKCIVAKA